MLQAGLIGRINLHRGLTCLFSALDESEMEIRGDIYQLAHHRNNRPHLTLEVQAKLRTKDQPSQPRGGNAVVERESFLPHSVKGLACGGRTQDILHRLQAVLDSLGEIRRGMNAAENILNNDRHHDTHSHDTGQPQGVINPIIYVERASIPERDGAGNGEAKGNRSPVIGNDANQVKGPEEADTNTQKVSQRIVNE